MQNVERGTRNPLLRDIWDKSRAIDIAAWRRHFHMYPCLSGDERDTAESIVLILRDHGVEAGIVEGQNAVMATIRGNHSGDIVALRADIDALPIKEAQGRLYGSRKRGIMHACGHDAHTAILIAAGAILQSMRDKLRGEVRLLFEPAEETTGGARAMIEAGCMDGVAEVYGLHMAPNLLVGQLWTRTGAMSGSSGDLIIKVCGTPCHGAYPERGVDAILTASHIVVALQSIISRNLSPFDNAVVSLGMMNGGTAPNIVAGEVTIQGTIRALSEEARQKIIERINALASGIAQSFGASCEVVLNDGYSPVICDEEIVNRLFALANEVGIETLVKPTPSLGVDSFGDLTTKARGVYYDIGCASAPNAPPIHTPSFDIDEACLPIGAYLQAGLAITRLNNIRI